MAIRIIGLIIGILCAGIYYLVKKARSGIQKDLHHRRRDRRCPHRRLCHAAVSLRSVNRERPYSRVGIRPFSVSKKSFRPAEPVFKLKKV